MINKTVKPFYKPISLIYKQTASFIHYSLLAKWRKAPNWLISHGFRTLPVSAGAVGMGCIGYPNHPVWEITAACNERCLHCHASGGKPAPDELTTVEGKRLIEEIARCQEFRMLVYTGGEPMIRSDLFELLEYSKKIGFRNVIATNAIDIDNKMAASLKKAGVYGLAISLDHTDPDVHNEIRRRKDAFELAVRGIEACRKNGIVLQINVTAMEYNIDDIENVLRFSDKVGAAIVLNYQLVGVGRGSEIKDKAVDIERNRQLMNSLTRWQRNIVPIIEPVASPQFWPNLLIENGKTSDEQIKKYSKVFHGCTAGRGLAYIKPNGDVWSCPFVEVSAGNVREKSFDEIWRKSPFFERLRNRDLYEGKCGRCRFREICGGCRGKAWSETENCFAEDHTCFINDSIKLP